MNLMGNIAFNPYIDIYMDLFIRFLAFMLKVRNIPFILKFHFLMTQHGAHAAVPGGAVWFENANTVLPKK